MAASKARPTTPSIVATRQKLRRNFLATLLLAQGVPLLLAGDEVGNSQGGNNNAYCQDNEIGWVDWSGLGRDGRGHDRADRAAHANCAGASRSCRGGAGSTAAATMAATMCSGSRRTRPR